MPRLNGKDYDFIAYSCTYENKCTDGTTIKRHAFADFDGKTTGFYFSHNHKDPDMLIGKVTYEDRPEGLLGYYEFNNNPKAQSAKEAVRHGDIASVSIYANHLDMDSQGNIYSGNVVESSLVPSPADPGSKIMKVSISHSDGSFEDLSDEGILFNGNNIRISHSDLEGGYMLNAEDVINSMSDEQANALENSLDAIAHGDEIDEEDAVVLDTLDDDQAEIAGELIDDAIEENDEEIIDDTEYYDDEDVGDYDDEDVGDYDDEDVEDYDEDLVHGEEGGMIMPRVNNVFDNPAIDDGEQVSAIAHSDLIEMLEEAKSGVGTSLKDVFIAHADGLGIDTSEYGIRNIDTLFPDYRPSTTTPIWVDRRTEWVKDVMTSVHHIPFTRVKSWYADITADEARAKGYIKGDRKEEEVFSLLQRTTDPQTIYKKQKLDKDDVIDITSFDVVAWIKTEMRGKLDEEIARAILIGDGRQDNNKEKIRQEHVRSIYLDNDFFTMHRIITIPPNATYSDKADKYVENVLIGMEEWRGSGTPKLYCDRHFINEMLLAKDFNQRKIYKNVDEVASAFGVKAIVPVDVFRNVKRTEGDHVYFLRAIVVNLEDYYVGADKGGGVNLFDDFDLNFNQLLYLIETRISGALVTPYSALVLENELGEDLTLTVDPEDPESELLGKKVSELQSRVHVSEGDEVISGTLNYVTGYTGYSSDVKQQSGNYLALKMDSVDGAVIKAKLIGGSGPEVTLDEDKNIVIRVTDPMKQILQVTSTKENNTKIRRLKLTSLILKKS